MTLPAWLSFNGPSGIRGWAHPSIGTAGEDLEACTSPVLRCRSASGQNWAGTLEWDDQELMRLFQSPAARLGPLCAGKVSSAWRTGYLPCANDDLRTGVLDYLISVTATATPLETLNTGWALSCNNRRNADASSLRAFRSLA